MTATLTVDALEIGEPFVRPTPTRAPRAVIYSRISRDRTGARLGVERQESACRDLAATLGAEVVLVRDDNDMSGYKRSRPRPGFDAICALIEAGQVDVLIAWHVDRLTRRLSELADLIALCQRHGVAIHTSVAGAFDPNSPTAVLQYQIAGAVAEYESAIKSERQKGKHKQLRETGMVHGGIRMFGYEHDRTIREAEATYVRQVAARILNGESLRSCALWLAAQGVPTVRGGAWTGPNLRTYLMRPALAGLVAHGTGKARKITGQATWQGILDRGQWEALEGILANPERRTSSTNARVHFLTGLAVCGACGAPLRVKASGRQRNGRRTTSPVAYACRVDACGKVYRRMDRVDDQVREWVVTRLAQVDLRGLLADNSAAAELATITQELDALPGRLEDLATRYALGRMTETAYEAATNALEAERVRLKAAADTLTAVLSAPERALEGLVGPDPAQVFDDLPLSRQRAVVDVLATVTIMPGKGTAYRPELTVITPKIR